MENPDLKWKDETIINQLRREHTFTTQSPHGQKDPLSANYVEWNIQSNTYLMNARSLKTRVINTIYLIYYEKPYN